MIRANTSLLRRFMLRHVHLARAFHGSSQNVQKGMITSISPSDCKVSTPLPVYSSANAQFSTHSPRVVMRINDLGTESYKNKTVFVRVDYNVTMELVDGEYQVKKSSYKRIIASLPTIRYLLNAGAKVVLASHLGDPKDDPKPFSLAPVVPVLHENLNVPVSFASDCIGAPVHAAVRDLKPGCVLMLENLRYHKGEKKNDPSFVDAIISAINPDIYVNDAFGTAHRAHASVVGLPATLRARAKLGGNPVPCISGFLMGQEVRFLSEMLPQARVQGNCFVAVLGGAKVTSKLPVFKNLLPRVDKVIIGGAMALPFLKAQGFAISNVDEDNVAAATAVLKEAAAAGAEVVLPVDFTTASKFEDPAVSGEVPVVHTVDAVPEGAYCLDIGPQSIELFKESLKNATTAVWNGPMGRFEWDAYSEGSVAIVEALSSAPNTTSVVGGGETAQVVALAGKKKNFTPSITHVSTGGGASLEMLQGDELPAITALDSK